MPDGLNPASAALWYGGLRDRQDVHLSAAARVRALRDHGRKNDYAVVLPHVDGPYSLAHADSQNAGPAPQTEARVSPALEEHGSRMSLPDCDEVVRLFFTNSSHGACYNGLPSWCCTTMDS